MLKNTSLGATFFILTLLPMLSEANHCTQGKIYIQNNTEHNLTLHSAGYSSCACGRNGDNALLLERTKTMIKIGYQSACKQWFDGPVAYQTYSVTEDLGDEHYRTDKDAWHLYYNQYLKIYSVRIMHEPTFPWGEPHHVFPWEGGEYDVVEINRVG